MDFATVNPFAFFLETELLLLTQETVRRSNLLLLYDDLRAAHGNIFSLLDYTHHEKGGMGVYI